MSMHPFIDTKVPICNTLNDVKEIISKYSDSFFCLYLAYKDPAAWEVSTSRIYMNHVLPNLIYLPVNIEKK